MHWVVQRDLWNEEGMVSLVQTLAACDIPYSIHKVIPFVGEIEPDVNPEGPVIVIGAYSMVRLAQRKGWVPGAFIDNMDFATLRAHWGDHMLNADAMVHRFDRVPEQEVFFLRPNEDSKLFAGQVFDWAEYVDFRTRVCDLREDDGSNMKPDVLVVVSTPKLIRREYRLWVVDGEIVTASLYKIGDRVQYDVQVDPEVFDYARTVLSIWQPDRAFCLDLAMIQDYTYRVIEVNSMNSAGLYMANVPRIVDALERLAGRYYGQQE
jgi:ATP-grasp domain, R2K clade family 3